MTDYVKFEALLLSAINENNFKYIADNKIELPIDGELPKVVISYDIYGPCNTPQWTMVDGRWTKWVPCFDIRIYTSKTEIETHWFRRPTLKSTKTVFDAFFITRGELFDAIRTVFKNKKLRELQEQDDKLILLMKDRLI